MQPYQLVSLLGFCLFTSRICKTVLKDLHSAFQSQHLGGRGERSKHRAVEADQQKTRPQLFPLAEHGSDYLNDIDKDSSDKYLARPNLTVHELEFIHDLIDKEVRQAYMLQCSA